MSPQKQLWVEAKTGRLRAFFEDSMLLSSAQTPWEGMLLEMHRFQGLDLRDVAPQHHMVVLHMDRPFSVEWNVDGTFRPYRAAPGQFCILPSMMFYSARSRDSGLTVTVSLERQFVACAAHEFINADRMELAPRHEVDDPVMHSICLALKTEVEAGAPGGRWYGETLGSALAVHLARHYAVERIATRTGEGGLARHHLRRAIEFIAEHVTEDVPLHRLAAVIGMSPYHFARCFKQSTGLAPHQYLIQCRVSRAKEMLIGSEWSLADIAHRVGFCDQSHLTFHFKRQFGVTPKVLRQKFARTVKA